MIFTRIVTLLLAMTLMLTVTNAECEKIEFEVYVDLSAGVLTASLLKSYEKMRTQHGVNVRIGLVETNSFSASEEGLKRREPGETFAVGITHVKPSETEQLLFPVYGE